ncbi:hypothetical protein B0H14DRAFT_2600218 [Mycena olivaceomarginata]|nr:hypothetical protein B0H14DRAFT_2600218 [Mycena olivaceomarginata]
MARLVLCLLLSLLLASLALCSPASKNNASDISLTARATSPINFGSSKYIWTATYTQTGESVGLRKDFQTPFGKALVAAEIITTAFKTMTLYVNGAVIGGDDLRPRYSNRYCVGLSPFFNVFAVLASDTAADDGTTVAEEAAMIATILLTYSDGTTQTLVSDESWGAFLSPPVGFEQPTFNDLSWPAATVKGVFGDAPWDEMNIPTDPPTIAFDRGHWVWTDAIPADGDIPAGSRAFRRRFVPQPGQIPSSATVIITADSGYQLWVNGINIGFGNGFRTAETWNINFVSGPPVIVFAVLATNSKAGPAGLMMVSEINMRPSGPTNCVAGSFVLTDDQSWVSTKQDIPAGWQQVGFDDSSWPAVKDEGKFPNAQPWGSDVTIVPPTGAVNV